MFLKFWVNLKLIRLFCKELYGKKVIVQRTVSASGGGSYKLKNENGKVVTEKRVKEELDRILSCFNIQVDNPIAILNQDTAKSFLFACKPDKLYQFFMRATQLDDCFDMYTEAAEEQNKAELQLKLKEEQVKAMKSERDMWEKKYQFHQKIQVLLRIKDVST